MHMCYQGNKPTDRYMNTQHLEAIVGGKAGEGVENLTTQFPQL